MPSTPLLVNNATHIPFQAPSLSCPAGKPGFSPIRAVWEHHLRQLLDSDTQNHILRINLRRAYIAYTLFTPMKSDALSNNINPATWKSAICAVDSFTEISPHVPISFSVSRFGMLSALPVTKRLLRRRYPPALCQRSIRVHGVVVPLPLRREDFRLKRIGFLRRTGHARFSSDGFVPLQYWVAAK
jgi:hypothetical protein